MDAPSPFETLGNEALHCRITKVSAC